jgi:DNA-binding transcriptional regulator YiaG
MYRYEDAGLRNVWLASGYTVKKTPYGAAVAIQDVEGLTGAICRALANKPGRLTGAEFRYLRLHLGLSQKALAKGLGNTEQAVALWEKKGRIPLWADKQVRLLMIAHADGNEPVRKALERLAVVDRLVGSRLVVEETRRGWRSRYEALETTESTR